MIRYEARGRLVMAVPPGSYGEPVGMFNNEALATLAAAGMNELTTQDGRSHIPSHEHLQPARDFRAPHDWPTQNLPRLPDRT